MDFGDKGGEDVSRLIDADKALEWVDCMKPIHGIGLEPVVAVETIRDLIKGAPTIDAIPVKWLCEKIREEDRFGGIPFGEYLKVLIWEWHQQEDD